MCPEAPYYEDGRGVVVHKGCKGLIVLVSLVVVTVANAAPTMSRSTTAVDCAVFLRTQAHSTVAHEVTQVGEASDSPLAQVGVELFKPPVGFMDSPAPPIHTKSLPAVPGALLMGLTGFLCVSLVKDRRVWMAALAALLWAGQAGVQALPQLALRLTHKNHSRQQLHPEVTYPHYVQNSNRTRSDIEGTQYIGLLHHLAGIPQRKSTFTHTQWGKAKALTASHVVRAQRLNCARGNIFPSAIIPKQYSLNLLTSCLAVISQSIRFSPAFIFENLPRGPPELA